MIRCRWSRQRSRWSRRRGADRAGRGDRRASFESLLDDVAGHLNAQHGRLIDLTVWLLAHPEEWQGDGLWTPNQYLAWRCGIGPALASNVIAAAERAAELPAAIEAVRRGEMSLDQLMPIVRSVPAWADEQAVSLAKRLTVSQTRRMVKETDWTWQAGIGSMSPSVATTPDPSDEPDAEQEARQDDSSERPGRGVGPTRTGSATGSGPMVAGSSTPTSTPISAAVRIVAGRSPRGRVRPRSVMETAIDGGAFSTVSDVDGLIELAQRSLDTGDGTGSPQPLPGQPLPRARRRARNRSRHRDPRADRAVPRRATGTSIPWSSKRGLPVSVGRSQRTIPDRTRRTVLHRDGHCCQVPGCTATRGLDLHHIIHWSELGPTDTRNLITLCSRHHRMHHKHRLGITGNADDADSLVFTDARGRPIRASGANPAPPGGPPRPIEGRYEHPLGERLDRRWVTFVDPSIPPHLRHHHPDIA